ncbi:MAG: metallophosphoesterase [Patescibacteria group bacterium]
MKLALVSDSHDHWENLKKAVHLANEADCEVLLHAGDLIAPPGIEMLKPFQGEVYFVWGNNEGEKVGITRQMDAAESLTLAGDVLDMEIGGLSVFMNHYPTIAQLAFQAGSYDLVVYGHDHAYHVEEADAQFLINPGEICGYRTGVASFVIFDTKARTAERISL